MSQRTQTVCDECQVVKKESNHWHKVGVIDFEGVTYLNIGPAPTGEDVEIADVCGDSCLHKFIDRKLQIGAHRPAQIVEESNGEQERD